MPLGKSTISRIIHCQEDLIKKRCESNDPHPMLIIFLDGKTALPPAVASGLRSQTAA